MALKHVNAVIVGAGAGGGVIAKVLAEAGLSVVLLERGKWCTPFDGRKDDLRNQRTSVLGYPFGPDEEKNPRVVVDDKGREKIVKPTGGGYSNNAACVGGGTFSYGAHGLALHGERLPHALHLRRGARQHARRLADLLRTTWSRTTKRPNGKSASPATIRGNIFKAPRRKPLPMPPLAAQPRVPNSESGRPPAGSPPLRHSHAAQQRAL